MTAMNARTAFSITDTTASNLPTSNTLILPPTPAKLVMTSK